MHDAFRLPAVIGHRGAAESAPENTLAGFRRARASGAQWVEFDIRLTADCQCVVFHDETLDRTTGHAGRIDESPLSLIAGLDAGSWFGAAFAGEQVPPLDLALETIAGLGLGANIEMKRHPGWETETARRLAGAVARSWPEDLPPPMVSSFAGTMLAEVRRFAPHLPRGLLVNPLRPGYIDEAMALGCVSVNLFRDDVTPDVAAAVREAGLQLAAWVVDDPEQALMFREWGVGSMITGAPERIVAALGNHQSAV